MAFEPFMQLFRGIQGRYSQGIGGIQNSHQMAYLRHLQKEMNKLDPMNVPLNELDVVVFDIETTGFFPEKGESILSIGAVKMKGSSIIEEPYYSLVYYDQPIPNNIVELTGITNEQVLHAPPITDVMMNFFQFVQNSTLVAHHASHEKRFMQYISLKLFKTPFKHRIVDTSFLYKIAEPHRHHVALEQICCDNQIPILDRHNALGDAKMTAQLWAIYVEKVQKLGCDTLQDVYNHFARI
ncbi:exonuclease domain-containing protein [Lysinibacillus antri]|uniref:3'-5' exonuclease n=1 Tax=Lysinibacillus antri TaxID=2498145 RepID=A0A432LG16_9BACI|nr:exonuclease domain-containing protein [Lysinibacillus antri]RUL56875.1 3'-5' exonuclease [Lysinibacillus antri]